MLIDAVGIIRDHRRVLDDETYAAIAAARAAGTSERKAMLGNAYARLRLSSILPCLPDNDRIDDWLRVSNGFPSLLDCSLTERENW